MVLILVFREDIRGFFGEPVREVARFPEAAHVRVRAEDDDGNLVALRETQQRRMA